MTGVLIRDCKISGEPHCSVFIEKGIISRLVQNDTAATPYGWETIEGNGGSLYPGFIDTHCHPFEYGWLKRNTDLKGTTNITGLRLRLQAGIQRAKPGEWVTGMGWDQEAFAGKNMPTRLDIDDISPLNPVALTRVCGHVVLLNSRAIQELGLEGRKGAEYERDTQGNLTGIVKERALTEVFSKLPRGPETCAADLQSIEAEASRLGLTTLHCILSPEGFREELSALAYLQANASLSLAYRVYVPPEALDFITSEGYQARFQGAPLRINGVKLYADGSLGARTAALREPYEDDRSNMGILRYTDEELGDLVEKADSRGHQVIVHAIGDRAIEQAVGALARVAGARNPRRHRIEHASLLPKDLRAKLIKHGIRATVQPLFITSDTWAEDRLGEERVRDLYPLYSMLEEGIVASGGSDSPVESLSPVLGMWASMARGGIISGEALNLAQALSLYTSNAMANGFDDETSGIAEGRSANLTLLDSDTDDLHPALLRKVGVLATIVNGSVAHSYGAP